MEKKTSSFDELTRELNKSEEFRQEFRKQKPLYDILRELVICRNQQNLTQTELAKKLGKHQSSLARIESGDHDIRLGTLIELAEALGQFVSIRLYPHNDIGFAEDRDLYKNLFTVVTEPTQEPEPIAHLEMENA